MRYGSHLFGIAAVILSLVVLADATTTSPKALPTDIPQPLDQLPPGMTPATDQQLQEAMRIVANNSRCSIEDRLQRIEKLSAELQREVQALRQDLHAAASRTQPAKAPPEDDRVPSVHFR